MADAAIEQLDALLAGAQRVVVTCHKSPDGDALGSSLALQTVLRKMGKTAVVLTPDMPPRGLQWLPGVSGVVTYSRDEVRGQQLLADAQLVMCLDYNALSRLDRMGDAVAQLSCPRVLIDHHLNPQPGVWAVEFSAPEASSTCELLYRVLQRLGLLRLVDRRAATCLYVGMATDTGGFAYSCSSPGFYQVVASLMRRGIAQAEIYHRAINTFSEASLRLQGFALSQRMQIFPAYGASLIALSRDDLLQHGYRKGDTETLVNKPLAIPEVTWSTLLREDIDTGKVKVSCRSQGDFSVSDLCARYFNGGGHTNAAGGDYEGTLEQAVNVFHQILADLAQAKLVSHSEDDVEGF